METKTHIERRLKTIESSLRIVSQAEKMHELKMMAVRSKQQRVFGEIKKLCDDIELNEQSHDSGIHLATASAVTAIREQIQHRCDEELIPINNELNELHQQHVLQLQRKESLVKLREQLFQKLNHIESKEQQSDLLEVVLRQNRELT